LLTVIIWPPRNIYQLHRIGKTESKPAKVGAGTTQELL